MNAEFSVCLSSFEMSIIPIIQFLKTYTYILMFLFKRKRSFPSQAIKDCIWTQKKILQTSLEP